MEIIILKNLNNDKNLIGHHPQGMGFPSVKQGLKYCGEININ
jgi:hypothetical protein